MGRAGLQRQGDDPIVVVHVGVTAQVVSGLVCDVPTHGVWGQEQWVRRGVSRAVVPIATNQERRYAPQRVVGRRPTAFSRLGSERSGRDPSRFFPFPLPWTSSMGLFLFVLPRFSCVAYAFIFSHMSSMR